LLKWAFRCSKHHPPPPPNIMEEKNRVHNMTFNYTFQKKGQTNLLRVISTHLFMGPTSKWYVKMYCFNFFGTHFWKAKGCTEDFMLWAPKYLFHGIKVCGLPIERGAKHLPKLYPSYLPKNQIPIQIKPK
jgi:hypothetical protein